MRLASVTAVACIALATAIIIGVVDGAAFRWWEPPIWVGVALMGVYANGRRLRRRIRPREIADQSWLLDSASWPTPWSHHDLDGEETKADSDIARLFAAAYTQRRDMMNPGMFG